MSAALMYLLVAALVAFLWGVNAALGLLALGQNDWPTLGCVCLGVAACLLLPLIVGGLAYRERNYLTWEVGGRGALLVLFALLIGAHRA